jgi:hypothetical protein
LTQTPAGGGERGMNYAYRLCGLKLDSHFDLPALPQWDGPADAPADVICRLGEVPSRLGRPDYIAPIFQTSGAGEYLLDLPGTGRVLVRNGNEIAVEAELCPAPSNLSAILSGPIQAVLWHQRGLVPLHASVIVINERAVALCGYGAAGKSTLAAMLAAAGHGVIADDICVVDARSNGDMWVLPDSPRLQLWPDALAELGVATKGLTRAAPDKSKYFLSFGKHVRAEPQKLAAVVQVLRHHVLPPATLERLRGAQAAESLHDSVHARRPADALGRAQPIFATFARMASAGVSFWRLMVPEGLPSLRQAATKLLAALEG